ncbi:hypothetical protein FACS189415_6430 [Bacteroidia bacterium]|nr:hypothetical protein FACS189415_6430 [Bacteroidia bacterium]
MPAQPRPPHAPRRAQRSALAYWVDYVLLRAAVAALSYILLLHSLRTWWQAATLSGIATAMFCLAAEIVRRWRKHRDDQAIRGQLRDSLLLETLVMMAPDAFMRRAQQLLELFTGLRAVSHAGNTLLAERGQALVYCMLLQRHPESEVSLQTILQCFHALRQSRAQEGLLFSTAPFCREAEEFIRRLPLPITLVTARELLPLLPAVGMRVTQEQIDDAIARQAQQEREQRRKARFAVLSGTRLRAYLLCGFLLMAVAALTYYPVYYIIAAGTCFLLAALCFARRKLSAA